MAYMHAHPCPERPSPVGQQSVVGRVGPAFDFVPVRSALESRWRIQARTGLAMAARSGRPNQRWSRQAFPECDRRRAPAARRFCVYSPAFSVHGRASPSCALPAPWTATGRSRPTRPWVSMPSERSTLLDGGGRGTVANPLGKVGGRSREAHTAAFDQAQATVPLTFSALGALVARTNRPRHLPCHSRPCPPGYHRRQRVDLLARQMVL